MGGQLIRQRRIWKLFKAFYTETSKFTLAKRKRDQSPINRQGYMQEPRPTNFIILMK